MRYKNIVGYYNTNTMVKELNFILKVFASNPIRNYYFFFQIFKEGQMPPKSKVGPSLIHTLKYDVRPSLSPNFNKVVL